MDNIVLETKLVSDIKGTFYVPSYQRGYRWSDEEVRLLLNDIYTNGEANYCLQPVVVRNIGDRYELIDGQQRLTTLYLIYQYLKQYLPVIKVMPFNLVYETRDKSEEFLQSVDLNRRGENILWHIAKAYEVIRDWFEEDPENLVMEIHRFFRKFVKIIWYEVGENEDAIALFTRLNIGKIPLTSAELVKAMFLKGNREDVNKRRRQEEISLQWDNMEKALHDDSLWYFLTNRSVRNYQTRIDLVLDLIAQKPVDTRETYYTFFELEKMAKANSLDHLWRTIQQTFLTLKDWYANHELYHKIGYLIASEAKTLQEIYIESQGKTKHAFRDLLDGFIRESIDIQGNYADLSYIKPTDYRRISTLLLLFNVESVRQIDDHAQRFPFDKFKSDKGGWTLEHIHAQQSEGMNTQEVWKEWLRLHMRSVTSVHGSNDLIQRMQSAIDAQKLDGNTFNALQKEVVELLSTQGNGDYLQSIGNLALLNSDDNAALNNSTFDVKRNMIVDMDRAGKYIPHCTKMVFLKYYTQSDANQLHFWGQPDRIAYIGAMNTILADYLSEPISQVEEA